MDVPLQRFAILRRSRYLLKSKSTTPLILAVVSAAIALPAHAEPQVYKDSDGGVYISGLVPKEVVKIAYGGRGQKIQVRPSGTCNVLKIPYKASEPGFYPWNQVDLYAAGTEDVVLSFSGANLASVDLVGKSLCAGTVRSTSFSWTALSGGAYGIREINNKAVYIVGLPYKLYEARDGLPAIRLQKANTTTVAKLLEITIRQLYRYKTHTFAERESCIVQSRLQCSKKKRSPYPRPC